MIYLLLEQAFEKIRKHLDNNLDAWENHNLDFGFGYWVTDRTLEMLWEKDVDLEILARRDPLPVFVDLPDSQVQELMDKISSICISRVDGSRIKAVSSLQLYGDYRYCLDLQRCFEYSTQAQPKQFWHVIGHQGDLEWLKGHWAGCKKFSTWLFQNRNILVW